MSDTDLIVWGISPLAIIVSGALTLPISLFLLWLYRRAVMRGMRASTGLGQAPQRPPPAQAVPRRGMPLAIVRMKQKSPRNPAAAADPIEQAAKRSLHGAVLVYVLAGLAYSLVVSGGWLAMAGITRLLSFFSLFLITSHAWPVVIAVNMIAALDRKDNLISAGTYLVVQFVITIAVLLVNPAATPLNLIGLWVALNGPGTLMMAASHNRWVRAVGPLVLAFMLAGVSGAFIVTETVGGSDELVRILATAVYSIGLRGFLGGLMIYILLNLVGFTILGLLGWFLLGWIGRLYRRKRMSDLSITLDSMWLVFAVTHGIVAGSTGLGWAVAAFVAYKLVVWVGLHLLRRAKTSKAESPTLLLLRVFSLGRRSERLFDRLTKRWRRAGCVSLIAGPDLLTATVEPHEFLDFLGRKLSRQFVSCEEELNRRLTEIDTGPDPDGRYRVNDFFCQTDTWRITMRRLAQRSDAVLMDLRSFTPSNLGCLYELEQLLASIPVAQFVLIIDDTTDQPFLESTLQELWQQVPADSPNRSLPAPGVRLFHTQSGSGVEVRSLLQLVFLMCRQRRASLGVR